MRRTTAGGGEGKMWIAQLVVGGAIIAAVAGLHSLLPTWTHAGLLAFPSMLMLCKAVQDDGKVNWGETASLITIFGLTVYFLAVRGSWGVPSVPGGGLRTQPAQATLAALRLPAKL